MAPSTTSDSSSNTSGGLSSTTVSDIIVGLMIFACALLGMGCVYCNRKIMLRLCTTRRLGQSFSPALAAPSRRRSGASSPTSTISYNFERTSPVTTGMKDDVILMYSREIIQTPSPTYRPQSRYPSLEPNVPATNSKPTSSQTCPTLVHPTWPVASKLSGGRLSSDVKLSSATPARIALATR
ncbi:hypothetical protein K466DRAFT_350560 [Polyporus arcularius HHB13444]|uniref:Uncharacterized protein n=1 Tax=Polyporus arcularius HHB13444 TaxID=1314778 RepID=A0A5C3PNS9_9APHY|nr:hypothetical protein K466DRAFT_350560 [Polyporus arcularius HHB13444]